MEMASRAMLDGANCAEIDLTLHRFRLLGELKRQATRRVSEEVFNNVAEVRDMIER